MSVRRAQLRVYHGVEIWTRLMHLGVAKLWVNKVFDMRLIIWEYVFMKLSAVERKYE